MLTRKYFVASAELMRRLYVEGKLTDANWRETVDALVRVFAADDPCFDEARFRNACNPYDTGGEA